MVELLELLFTLNFLCLVALCFQTDLNQKIKESKVEISTLKTKVDSQINEDSPKYIAQFNTLEKEKGEELCVIVWD